MKIRNKILLIAFMSLCVLLLVIYSGSHIIILKNFNLLEHKKVEDSLQQGQAAINSYIKGQCAVNSDWAHWDDAYQFMLDKNVKFIEANISPTFFADTKIDHMLFYDNDGKFFYGRSFDSNTKNMYSVPPGIVSTVSTNPQLLEHKTPTDSISGFLTLPNGDIISFCSLPITTTLNKGPTRGNLIMAADLNNAAIDSFSKVLQLPIHIYNLHKQIVDPIINQVWFKLNAGSSYITLDKDSNIETGFTFLRDYRQQPIAIMQIDYPRNIYLQGLHTINFYIFIVAIAVIIVIIVVWFLLKTLVLNRLFNIVDKITEITQQNKYADYVPVDSKDELGELATSLNSLLKVVYLSHSDLEGRVKERTKKLEAEIVQRQKAEEKILAEESQLDHMAHHDVLTDLPNRVMFNKFMQKSLATASIENKQIGILFLDLDRFKFINDALGHSAGDEFLQTLAQKFQQNLRKTDIISRFGGDEFLFVVSDFTTADDLGKYARKVLDIVSEKQIIKSQSVQLTGSIGIAVYPTNGTTLEELISNADLAMYKAKETGKAQYEFFTDIMNAAAKAELLLENDLRDAIKKEEIKVFYQPLFSVADSRICGVEALLRWQHPKLGLVLPKSFIGLAESTGLINALGELVLLESLKTFDEWKKQGIMLDFITVNVSSKQFNEASFPNLVINALQKVNLPGDNLVIEITESVFMQAEKQNLDKLRQLGDNSIKIAIDDFGSVYSSISYLSKFPISFLKIDREFIRNLSDDRESRVIIDAMLSLGKALNIKIIAEGIETQEQFDYLKEHGCDIIQGFLISRPLNITKITALLDDAQKNK